MVRRDLICLRCEVKRLGSMGFFRFERIRNFELKLDRLFMEEILGDSLVLVLMVWYSVEIKGLFFFFVIMMMLELDFFFVFLLFECFLYLV